MAKQTEDEPKATQDEVFAAIKDERRYQNLLPKTRSDGKMLPVAGEILLMEELLAKTRLAYYDNAGDQQALDRIRKLVGVGVRCLENHGVIPRVW
jgi:hypothetical protein